MGLGVKRVRNRKLSVVKNPKTVDFQCDMDGETVYPKNEYNKKVLTEYCT